MKSYEHVVSFALDHPWAITKPMLSTIASILGRRLSGEEVSAEDVQAAVKSRRDLPQPRRGTVGILPVYGVIVPRGGMMTEASGLTSVDALSQSLRDFVADESVTTIVMDVDSPGGNVAGITEFAREILSAREQKPIIAVAHFTMASAAYWLAASATEVVASPSAKVGAIGVYTMHNDLSKALEMMGIKRTYISAGKHKVEDRETEPLSEEAHAAIKAEVDEMYGLMIADIAKGRGVSESAVRSGFGEGRVVGAAKALELGMVDRVSTFRDVVTRLVGRKGVGDGRMASAVVDPLASAETIMAGGPATPPAAQMDPDEDGNCPEGYEKGDDGMCHLMDDEAKAARASKAAAGADEAALLAARSED